MIYGILGAISLTNTITKTHGFITSWFFSDVNLVATKGSSVIYLHILIIFKSRVATKGSSVIYIHIKNSSNLFKWTFKCAKSINSCKMEGSMGLWIQLEKGHRKYPFGCVKMYGWMFKHPCEEENVIQSKIVRSAIRSVTLHPMNLLADGIAVEIWLKLLLQLSCQFSSDQLGCFLCFSICFLCVLVCWC